MQVDIIFKIAAVGLIVAILNQVLSKSGRDEQALIITLAGLVIVLLVLVQQIGVLFTTMKQVFGF
jgi:stage III sporulation protein AC